VEADTLELSEEGTGLATDAYPGVEVTVPRIDVE
jgi:hypothetical protein